MLKVLAACGNGMGSSMIIKMKIDEVLNEMGIEHEVHHSSVGQGKSEVNNYDLIIVASQLTKEFDPNGKAKIVGIQNLLSADEIREKVTEALKE